MNRMHWTRNALVLSAALAVSFGILTAEGGGISAECKAKMQALEQDFHARKKALHQEFELKKQTLKQEFQQRREALRAECKGADWKGGAGAEPWKNPDAAGQHKQKHLQNPNKPRR